MHGLEISFQGGGFGDVWGYDTLNPKLGNYDGEKMDNGMATRGRQWRKKKKGAEDRSLKKCQSYSLVALILAVVELLIIALCSPKPYSQSVSRWAADLVMCSIIFGFMEQSFLTVRAHVVEQRQTSEPRLIKTRCYISCCKTTELPKCHGKP